MHSNLNFANALPLGAQKICASVGDKVFEFPVALFPNFVFKIHSLL